jgi:hypothetical protein
MHPPLLVAVMAVCFKRQVSQAEIAASLMCIGGAALIATVVAIRRRTLAGLTLYRQLKGQLRRRRSALD